MCWSKCLRLVKSNPKNDSMAHKLCIAFLLGCLFQVAVMGQSSKKIEAEDFTAMRGIKLEQAQDEGNGKSLAFISNDDYTEYPVHIPEPGAYKFRFRIASNNPASGNIELRLDETEIGALSVPYTKGWQSWQSVSQVFKIPKKGDFTLRLHFKGDEGSLFNLNWFSYGLAKPVKLTIGDQPLQKMRYGMDFERLWYWPKSKQQQQTLAKWSVQDCDIDYIRVAINCGYELEKGKYDPKAYSRRILPMMRAMQAADPELKFFASPRPLDEAIDKAAWQPYPRWITGQSGKQFDFKPKECADYLVRYIKLMETNGFKIDFLDVTNEWQGTNSKSGKLTAADVVDIRRHMEAHLSSKQMPKFIAPSAWSYLQGAYWMRSINSAEKRQAIDIAAAHNTDKSGSAKLFAKAAKTYLGNDVEIWNTELHGWKSVKSADEVLTSSYLFEAIDAGFSGINGWLAVGTKNQGHCYYLNEGGKIRRNVKYYIFKKLANTSNYGHALSVDHQDKFKYAIALIKKQTLTIWIVNDSPNGQVIHINLPNRNLAKQSTIKQTRWSEIAQLPVEGVSKSITASSPTVIERHSVYCFELALKK